MRYKELCIPRNKAVRVVKSDGKSIVYQGKSKKMPESVLEYLSEKAVREHSDVGGVMVITLYVNVPKPKKSGKTILSTVQKEMSVFASLALSSAYYHRMF